MKSVSIVAFASLVAACMAQSIDIAAPLPGTVVHSNENIIVEIDRPLTTIPIIGPNNPQEIALVLSIAPCVPGDDVADCSAPSYDPSKNPGTTVYNGPYNPVVHELEKPPYQKFPVHVPAIDSSSFLTPVTQVSLTATHFSLVNPGSHPFFEVKNVILGYQS